MKNVKLADHVFEFLINCDDDEFFKLNVSLLALKFHVDRSHLAREFKASKNCTLCKFIKNEKMKRAASILSSSKVNMECLSKTLGFCKADYFREVFKKHFGVTPGLYARRKKNNI
ncbi:MAG: AraC family transcriptional regulator [Acidobacteria bacterium]|jgi:AraC-like DNA-binding protein|nr:AraC family transcriptional regulator [Acidobacteriota bacterium]